MKVFELGNRKKIADGGRIIKSFGDLPGESLFLHFSLQVTGSKIHSQAYLTEITVCMLLLNALPQPVNPDHHLQLVMNILGKIGVKNGRLAITSAESGFMKKTGFDGTSLFSSFAWST